MAGYRQFLASGKICQSFPYLLHQHVLQSFRCAEHLSWELFVFKCDKYPLSNIDMLTNNVLVMIFDSIICVIMVDSIIHNCTSTSDEVDMPDKNQQHTLQLSLGSNMWNIQIPVIIRTFSNRNNSRRSRPAF